LAATRSSSIREHVTTKSGIHYHQNQKKHPYHHLLPPV
jgi:hypothetical protein